MLSRTASNLYWMARYFERAESTARLLNACFQPGTPFAGDLNKLYDLPLHVQSAYEDFAEQKHELNMNNVIRFMISGDSRAAIKSCLEISRENARSERSRMSTEVWEVVNQTWIEFNEWQNQPLHLFKEWLQQRSFMLQGAINNTMPAHLSRHFLRIGMLLERADQTLRILETEIVLRTFSNQSDYYHWNIILRSVGSFEAYQEIFVNIPSQESVLQFLLFNKTIPRSVRFCIEDTEHILNQIRGQNRESSLKRGSQLLVKLRFDKLDDINHMGQREYIESLQKDVFALAAAIEEGHFCINMILNVHHSTKYSYLEPVHKSIQIIRLTPFNNHRQKLINWSLQIPGHANTNIDWFGNITHCVNVPTMLTEIEITATGKVEVFPTLPNPELGTLPDLYYLRGTTLTAINQEMKNLALSINLNSSLDLAKQTTDEILQALTRLSASILNNVTYQRGITDSLTTAIDAFKIGGGVCQDHAHIFLACARFLGIPARYVSGYLHTDDTSHLASHAWAEVWLHNAWYSFDISNQCQADETHIELAYGLDYLDASPIRGSRIGGGEERLVVLSLVTDH